MSKLKDLEIGGDKTGHKGFEVSIETGLGKGTHTVSVTDLGTWKVWRDYGDEIELITIPMSVPAGHVKEVLVAYFVGLKRGRAEGRNDLRQRLASMINNMESVG